MRVWFSTLALLFAYALGAAPAAAQAQLDCSALPAIVCQDQEVLALEGDRLALIAQIAAADPQSPATAGEQAWLDGLSACGEAIECYRAAYLMHNQALRQALPATPEPAPEEPPPDAASEAPAAGERASARDERGDRGGPIYAPGGLPGWGFFTAIGLTLLILFWLLRARARNRDALHEDEAQLRNDWR